MITLGITGGIGSGKSTVSKLFNVCGIPIYIADIESKRLTAQSPIIRKELINLFGESLYNGNELNKLMLASLIFTNEENLKQVNKIIHPEVAKDYLTWVSKNREHKILVKETAILFESGFNKLVDTTIMVYTPLEQRIERTIKRDNSTRKQVEDRIKNQMSDEVKSKLSDYIIVNDGTLSLIKQVCEIIDVFK